MPMVSALAVSRRLSQHGRGSRGRRSRSLAQFAERRGDRVAMLVPVDDPRVDAGSPGDGRGVAQISGYLSCGNLVLVLFTSCAGGRWPAAGAGWLVLDHVNVDA